MAAGQEVAAPNTKCVDSVYSCYDSKACDGPGDCPTGQVCCLDQIGVGHGSCTDGNDDIQESFACEPAVAGSTPCRIAEVCSAVDPGCTRPGSRCVIDEAAGRGACEVPAKRRPTCGDAPCGAGLVCIESGKDGTRRCVGDYSAHKDQAFLIECDGASQCAPDETCYAAQARGHLCMLNYVDAFNDTAVCQVDSDCVNDCKSSKTAFCTLVDKQSVGRCECRPPCQRDPDCRRFDCRGLALRRFRSAFVGQDVKPFCDRQHRRCECSFD